MSFETTLLNFAKTISDTIGPVNVKELWVPEPHSSSGMNTGFGIALLDEGSAGLYYARLEGTQAFLPRRLKTLGIEGKDAFEIAQLYCENDDGLRSIGLATINALTSALFRFCGYRPPTTENLFGGLALTSGSCLGMIGYFAPLAQIASRKGVKVFVLEKKPHLVKEEGNVVVSLDPDVLSGCKYILCTGATALNASFCQTLRTLPDKASVVLTGPTVGFPPDAVLSDQIRALAGIWIEDGEYALQCIKQGIPMKQYCTKTLITHDNYPGLNSLIRSIKA